MNMFEDLLGEFLATTRGTHGMLARPNDTHYAYNLVAEAVRWMRDELAAGRTLTMAGERFVAGAAAYLGSLAYASFRRRGFEVGFSACWEPGGRQNQVVVEARRVRHGVTEHYGHDFLRDMNDAVLFPPRAFPAMRGRCFLHSSTSLAPIEYLYMTGVHFMSSPLSGGNWPEGPVPGGLDEDFHLARELLIDDLLVDVGCPTDEPALRRLATWVVWPPYGWERNEGQEHNLLALIDQIALRKVVPLDVGVEFLRALLRAQGTHIRHLGARALMLLDVGPADPDETRAYAQALHASDHAQARPAMERLRWMVEARPGAGRPPADFGERLQARWRAFLQGAPMEPWAAAPILRDPLYLQLGALDPENHRTRAALTSALLEKYPDDWFAAVAGGLTLLYGPHPEEGEAILRAAMAATPGSAAAHFTLAGWYWEQGLVEEATRIYLDAVRRRPWDGHAVANAMWIVTDPMVS